MFGKRKDYFTKQYRRRTFCGIVFCYVTFLSAFREDPSKIETTDKDLIPKLSNYRPFSPYAQAIGTNEIRVQWLPVANKKGANIYYELYNGDDLEYVGLDLVHYAKRLHTGREYMFQLRVCNALVPGDCSNLSFPRHQKLSGISRMPKWYYIPVIIPIALTMLPLTTVIIIALASLFVWLFVRRLLGKALEKDTCSFDNINETYHIDIESKGGCTERKCFIVHSQSANSKLQSSISQESQRNHGNIPLTDENSCSEENDTKPKQTASPKQSKKKHRKRSKTISQSSKQQISVQEKQISLSDSEIYGNETAVSNEALTSNVVVVIDNSNIFIGARETVCNAHGHVKPKQVKLRLQQLLNVVENKRSVSRAFTGASSPPANENVWDIYRRHGYTVDLEDRRGKDEQRVDELLHLAIYKALVELPPQTLILVTGDGNKGKSKGDTSFISCAEKAIEYGWKVELLSWKHSLSTEWIKLMTHYEEKLKIIYLDSFVDILTSVERKHNRRNAVGKKTTPNEKLCMLL